MKFFLQIGVLLSTSFILAQNISFTQFYQTEYAIKGDFLTHKNLIENNRYSYIFDADTNRSFVDYSKSKILSISLYVSWRMCDFSEFRNELGNYNADFLTDQPVFTGLELAFYGPERGYIGLRSSGLAWFVLSGFGIAGPPGYALTYNDTIVQENRLMQLGLHGGYTILKIKGMNLTPKIGVDWNRHRLLNYHTDSSIQLSQYVKQREMDVRFNQLMGMVGANVNVNFRRRKEPGDAFWSIGFSGGFCFKLHKYPLVYSVGHKLSSPSRIYYEPFCFSISVAFNGTDY